LSGSTIDRSRPLSFRLNGEEIAGYAGDTVLSAALACGVLTAGDVAGLPLALDEAFNPPVAHAGKPASAMSMDRMTAIDGADLVTLGVRRMAVATPGGPLHRALRFALGPKRTLGHLYDGPAGLHGPWVDAETTATKSCDLAVVGGGVAGMSAAIAGVIAGQHVVLIEQDASPGGAVGWFGASEGEEEPASLTHRLNVELAQVEVITGACVLALHGTTLRVHTRDGVLRIAAKRVVLAMGAEERLPVFPGNRSPGVSGALAAWRRAQRYGVWIGRRALFSTTTNHAYRLAVAAAGAGIQVQSVYDTRPMPQSRHVDYAKATGVPLAYGLAPREVRPAPQGLVGLHAAFAAPFDEDERIREPIWTEQLVVSGGWQPDLGLWHMAGGRSRWNAADARLEPLGELPNVALAGAAAGWRGTGACLQSGSVAVAQLLGRPRPQVEDARIDPVFETPDGPTPVTPRRSHACAYLASGTTLAALPPLRPAGAWASPIPTLEEHARGLSTADIASAVQLGLVAPEDAPVIAAERAAEPVLLHPGEPPAPLSRAFLDGRFGPDAAMFIVAAGQPRAFEAGSLIYSGGAHVEPVAAVGVVVAQHEGGRARAIMKRGAGLLQVRDAGGLVRIAPVEEVMAP
jgi:sarcosine oxidase subunit alpha